MATFLVLEDDFRQRTGLELDCWLKWANFPDLVAQKQFHVLSPPDIFLCEKCRPITGILGKAELRNTELLGLKHRKEKQHSPSAVEVSLFGEDLPS